MAFTVLTWVSFWTLWQISIGVSIAALLATIWMTLGRARVPAAGWGRLGPRRCCWPRRCFWTEPVQRTLYLGPDRARA